MDIYDQADTGTLYGTIIFKNGKIYPVRVADHPIKTTLNIINKAKKEAFYPKKPVEPVVFLTLTDNWINLNIRYVTETKERRIIKNNLSKLILNEIEKSKNIKIASENIDINLKK